MKVRGNILFQNLLRYLFSVIVITGTFAVRIELIQFTGTGAPFVLFFAAVLVISLLAGVGPGICAVLLSMPLAGYMFVMRAGYPVFQAAFESILFAVDGFIVVYLTSLMTQGREALQNANRQLQSANEEITKTERRTREVIELAPDAFFLADLDARFTDVNHAACRLLGYDRDELIGKTIFDIIPAEDAPRLRAVKADLLVPGRVDRGEWTLKRNDATIVPVEVSAKILPDGRWQAFVRDITERKQIEDERQVFVSFLQNSSDFIGIADADGKPVYVNPAGRRMVGLPADFPVENTKIPEYYTPDQREFASDVIVRSMIEQGRWHGETYFRHWQTQQAIPVSDEHFMIRDPRSGRVLGMGTITRDISEARRIAAEREQLLVREQWARQQAESANERLQESEAKFSGIISIAADAIISVDADQRITIFNEGAESIFGYSRIEVVGAPLEILIPERFRAIHRQHFARFAASREAARPMGERRDVFGIRKSGEEFPAEASISKVNVGGMTLFSVVLRDITDRKNTEEALRRAVTARDHVLGIVAHDLRNPLNNIMQCVALERGGPELLLPKAVEIISKAATRMNHLIQDLLDVSLVEAGQMRIERNRLSAADVVREAVDMQTPLASSFGIGLRVDLGNDVYDIAGGHDRLLQVFENLIGNAMKFTKAGGNITVGAAAKDGEVLFWVSDTGCGIAPESLPHVFDQFWQATTRAGRLGAGLGLPITKGIVEAHGGRIWVESTMGRGSTFFFTIPRVPVAMDNLDNRTDRIA